jgi:hypothetical protein
MRRKSEKEEEMEEEEERGRMLYFSWNLKNRTLFCLDMFS